MSTPSTLYFDHNATTSVDPRVLEAMLPYFTEHFGNSMSVGHAYGWAAETAVEKARKEIAALLNCEPKEIVFTSGATESNNWAIEGLVESIRGEEGVGAKIHLLVSPVEHNSVLAAAKRAERYHGVELDWLPLNEYGQVDASKVAAMLKPHTRLVCAMWVQNEIGSINPIRELTEICRANRVYLLSDATQALGKVPVDLKATPVDLLSFSAHKIGGPKGIGFLYQRSKDPRVQLPPFINGGGHEQGHRSGTLNVPAIVGMGVACKIAREEGAFEQNRLRELSQLIFAKLKEAFPALRLNGHPTDRSPNNLHLTFRNCAVPSSIAGLAVSRGSACLSGKTSMSHVLAALRFSVEEASQSLRLSLGRTTTSEEALEAVRVLAHAIRPKLLNSQENEDSSCSI